MGIYDQLSTLVGLPIPTLHFLVCFLATIPLCWAHRYIPSVTGRHLYAALTGTLLTYLCFGRDSLFLNVPCIAGYLAMLLYRRHCGLLTFALTFGFLVACHVVYMSGDAWKAGNIDFTGALMIVTLKVTSCAFNYQDGRLPVKLLHNSQPKLRLEHLPTPLEFLGFVFYCGNILSGPPFEMVDYLAYTERREGWAVGKDGKWPPSSGAVGSAFLRAVLSIVVYQALLPHFPATFLVTEEFARYPFWMRLGSMWLTGFTARWKYYFIWSMAEVCLILSGIGFSGWKGGNPTWDNAKNVDIRRVELAESAVKIPHYWNIRVGNWLRIYVYERVSPRGQRPTIWNLLLTQLVSALWHGLYPGYFLFFLNTAIMIEGSKIIYRWQQALPQHDQLLHAVAFLGQLLLVNLKECALTGFYLLTWRDTMAAWRSVYFLGVLVPLALVIFGRIFPPPRSGTVKAQLTKVAEESKKQE